MSTYLITQTAYAQVRPIDPSSRVSSEQLETLLRAHLEPAEFARAQAMFANPEPVMGTAATDWYTDEPGFGVPLRDLPDEERGAVLSEVGTLCAKIAHIADALAAKSGNAADVKFLRAVVSIPDNQDFIYKFGDQPVVVAWGHKLAAADKPPVPAGLWVAGRAADPGPAASFLPPQMMQDEGAVLASGPVAAIPVAGIGWLAWLLWALFLLLFLAILWILLTACSVGGPRETLIERLGFLNRCPVPIAATYNDDGAQASQAALRQQIRDAELALAEEGQLCRMTRVEEERERIASLPPPDPEVPIEEPVAEEPPAEDLIAEEADERVRDAGGQTGAMQVILQWDGPADLDMRVTCNAGRINHSSRRGCEGGELDVDANHEVNLERPVENIHWSEMPPTGTYGISVNNHNSKGDPRERIPFTLLVRQGDEERTYQGQVGEDAPVDVTRIVVP